MSVNVINPRSDVSDGLNIHRNSISNYVEDFRPYGDLILTQVISQVKFPVLLGHLPREKRDVAVKLFPHQNQKISPCFLNEIRFAGLRHENIISILHFEQEREAEFNDYNSKISLVIMELAPHGDFFDLITKQQVQIDDKLIRTFFRQLIEGLEYLHSVGAAHLDLKLDNLLIGEDYKLKICDFDQAYTKGQSILSSGTQCYRAPEILYGRCQDPEAADIYSVGIILFTLKSGGCLPYLETEKVQGVNMFKLMLCNPDLFWNKICQVQKRDQSFYDEDFKTLFISMVDLNPKERPSIKQIKESKWYTGAVYSQEEVQTLLKEYH